jgi:hypothetical protein
VNLTNHIPIGGANSMRPMVLRLSLLYSRQAGVLGVAAWGERVGGLRGLGQKAGGGRKGPVWCEGV